MIMYLVIVTAHGLCLVNSPSFVIFNLSPFPPGMQCSDYYVAFVHKRLLTIPTAAHLRHTRNERQLRFSQCILCQPPFS